MSSTAAPKHPDAIAWEKWLESERGQSCTTGSAHGEYLRNRLWWAFNAGIAHGETKERAERIVSEFIRQTHTQEPR